MPVRLSAMISFSSSTFFQSARYRRLRQRTVLAFDFGIRRPAPCSLSWNGPKPPQTSTSPCRNSKLPERGPLRRRSASRASNTRLSHVSSEELLRSGDERFAKGDHMGFVDFWKRICTVTERTRDRNGH